MNEGAVAVPITAPVQFAPNQYQQAPQWIPQQQQPAVQAPIFQVVPQRTAQQMPQTLQQSNQAPVFNPNNDNQAYTHPQQLLDITQMNKQQIEQTAASIIQCLNTIAIEMKQTLFERDDVIDDTIMALVAQHHILLLGPPGTAKTLLATELTSRITGARLFSWLLNKSSDPSEVLGPYSIKSMERDKFKRILDGKIADCELVFLDEIFKSNEPTLNILLSILNERIVYNDGKAHPVPLRMLIASSNEVPEEDDGLEAIYDRIMFKHWVNCIQDKSNRARMMQEYARRTAYGAKNNYIKTTISLEELVFINNVTQMVVVDNSVYNALTSALRILDKEGIKFSDRKLNWCIDVIRAKALLSGRMTATNDDIIALTYALWENWSDVPKVQEALLQSINPLKSKIENELKSIRQLFQEIVSIRNGEFKDPSGAEVTDTVAKMQYFLERTKKIDTASAKARQVLSTATKQGIDVSGYSAELTEISNDMRGIMLEITNVGTTEAGSDAGAGNAESNQDLLF